MVVSDLISFLPGECDACYISCADWQYVASVYVTPVVFQHVDEVVGVIVHERLLASAERQLFEVNNYACEELN